jgi:penicillin-binding protein 1A
LFSGFSFAQFSRTPGQKKPPSKNKKRGFSIKKAILKSLFVLGLWGIILAGLGILWFSYDLPDIHQLQSTARKPGVTIQAIDGMVIGTYGDLYEDMVRVSDLPPHVPQAFIAIEDRRFYSHFGLDLIGLMRALYTNYKADRVVQGGSTLTQQLAKNFLFSQGMYDVNDRSLRRKIQEALLSIWLEWTFTKEQILTIYLNRVYFGAGTYGIDAAARKYFNKSARNLTVFESAVIAGLMKAPSRYSPARYPERAKKRAQVVLDQMVEAGYIKSAEPYLQEQNKDNGAISKENGAKFFADWVYDSIPNYVGAYDTDLVVITTLDLGLQKLAEEAALGTLEKMGKELGTTEIALVSMTPQGAVKAMVGGKDYNASQFNRATQAYRQPGSAFKPFVYLAGLESGMSPYTTFSDAPISVGNWSPKNFRTWKARWKEGEEVSMIDALTHSVNTVTVRIAMQVGGPKIAAVARRLGITSHMMTDLSIALGTTEVTLLELVAAYATFANKGMSVWPYGIIEIRDKSGNILYQRQDVPETQVISDKHVHEMNKMLASVVERGTGRGAAIGSPIAGKTGSNGDRDAWFIGYNKDLVTGVRTGNDNNKPMKKQSTGGRLPAKAFAAFMKPVMAEKEATPFDLAASEHEAPLKSHDISDSDEEGDLASGGLSDISSPQYSQEDSRDFEALLNRVGMEE